MHAHQLQEINSRDWDDFCRRISQQRQGAMTTIEMIGPDGIKTEKAGSATLESMVLDTHGTCNSVISIRVRNNREITHEIIDPIRVMLKQTGEQGEFNSVQIEAENGTTLLAFHPAIHARMLEGLRVS